MRTNVRYNGDGDGLSQGAMGVQVACVVWPERAEAVRRLRAWEACLDALEGFSSVVEVEAPGVAYVDVTSLAPHYPDVETLAAVLARAGYAATRVAYSVGVAACPFAARMAAEGLAPGEVAVWPDGTERDRLAPLSVRQLPLDEETLDALWRAGLRTLDEVARLPATVIADTFGPTLWRAQRLARGEALRPLRPRQVILRESSRQTFEAPVFDTLRLRALRAIQVRDLADRLRRRSLRCARLRLTGELTTDDVWQSSRLLTEPSAASASLTQLADDALSEWPVALGVLAVTIALDTAPQVQTRETVLKFRAASDRRE